MANVQVRMVGPMGWDRLPVTRGNCPEDEARNRAAEMARGYGSLKWADDVSAVSGEGRVIALAKFVNRHVDGTDAERTYQIFIEEMDE